MYGPMNVKYTTQLKITPAVYLLLSYFEKNLFANNYLSPSK
jgi:hypothetical protein